MDYKSEVKRLKESLEKIELEELEREAVALSKKWKWGESGQKW